MKKKTRKNYTDEFKEEAFKLVAENGYKVTEAARNLGIHDSILRRWIKDSEVTPYAKDQKKTVTRLCHRFFHSYF